MAIISHNMAIVNAADIDGKPMNAKIPYSSLVQHISGASTETSQNSSNLIRRSRHVDLDLDAAEDLPNGQGSFGSFFPACHWAGGSKIETIQCVFSIPSLLSTIESNTASALLRNTH